MKKITKKDIKQIREGNHATLMDCLDFLLDSYNEDKWDLGYKACLSDMSVRAQRLSEYILKHTAISGKPLVPEDYEWYATDTLAKMIEDYFNQALK